MRNVTKCLIDTGISRFSLFFPSLNKKVVIEIDCRNKTIKLQQWHINDNKG